MFGLVLGAIAGGSSAGGGAQIAPTDNTAVSTYKVTDISPGANVQVGAAGAPTSQPSGPGSSGTGVAATDAASSNGGAGPFNGAGSSNGTSASSGVASSGFGASPRVTNDSSFAKQIAREKVIDTGDKAVETDKPAKVESSDKTFAPGLLDKVSDISAVGAQKEHGSSSKADDSKSAASEDKKDSHKQD